MSPLSTMFNKVMAVFKVLQIETGANHLVKPLFSKEFKKTVTPIYNIWSILLLKGAKFYIFYIIKILYWECENVLNIYILSKIFIQFDFLLQKNE